MGAIDINWFLTEIPVGLKNM